MPTLGHLFHRFDCLHEFARYLHRQTLPDSQVEWRLEESAAKPVEESIPSPKWTKTMRNRPRRTRVATGDRRRPERRDLG